MLCSFPVSSFPPLCSCLCFCLCLSCLVLFVSVNLSRLHFWCTLLRRASPSFSAACAASAPSVFPFRHQSAAPSLFKPFLSSFLLFLTSFFRPSILRNSEYINTYLLWKERAAFPLLLLYSTYSAHQHSFFPCLFGTTLFVLVTLSSYHQLYILLLHICFLSGQSSSPIAPRDTCPFRFGRLPSISNHRPPCCRARTATQRLLPFPAIQLSVAFPALTSSFPHLDSSSSIFKLHCKLFTTPPQ